MSQIHVTLDSNRSDEEPYRDARLERVGAYVAGAVKAGKKIFLTSDMFLDLYDHKGILSATAVMNACPEDAEIVIDLLIEAWDRECECTHNKITVFAPRVSDPYDENPTLIVLAAREANY